MNEWGRVIATLSSVLSIVPPHCARLTCFLQPKSRKINAVPNTPQHSLCLINATQPLKSNLGTLMRRRRGWGFEGVLRGRGAVDRWVLQKLSALLKRVCPSPPHPPHHMLRDMAVAFRDSASLVAGLPYTASAVSKEEGQPPTTSTTRTPSPLPKVGDGRPKDCGGHKAQGGGINRGCRRECAISNESPSSGCRAASWS